MKRVAKTILVALMIPWLVGSSVCAQGWPNKPIHLIVGFGAGGGTDVTARLFAQKLGVELKQSVVVENRVGAAGNIAAEHVSKSEPDGYRLLMIASGTFINNVLTSRPRYSVVQDLTPISFVTMAPLVLVAGPTVNAKSVSELIEQARAKPGAFTFSSDGVGGTLQLAGELFGSTTGTKLLHVPFKGAADATTAVAGGQVDLSFPSLTAAIPMLQARKVRALALTSVQRSTLLPDIPTLDELGLRGYEVIGWFGLMGPRGLPRSIVDRMNAALVSVARQADMAEALAKQALEVKLGSPEQFAAYLRQQAALIAKLGKDADIKVE